MNKSLVSLGNTIKKIRLKNFFPPLTIYEKKNQKNPLWRIFNWTELQLFWTQGRFWTQLLLIFTVSHITTNLYTVQYFQSCIFLLAFCDTNNNFAECWCRQRGGWRVEKKTAASRFSFAWYCWIACIISVV